MSVLLLARVEEPPTAMHAVGELHETDDNVSIAPARLSTGDTAKRSRPKPRPWPGMDRL
jgi:hypothetical protein